MNWKRFQQVFGVAAIVAALFLFVSSATMAQSVVTGGLTGTVTDQSGAVVAGASVALKDATGSTQTTTTGSSGIFQFTLLKPGTYTLLVTHPGFKQVSQTVDVLLGQTVAANVKLELGSSSTVVEVTSQPGVQLQTEDANITSNFDTKQIQEIPNPGGDVTYIAQVSPGVTMNNSTGGGFGNFSAFGLPGTANLFTFNGNDYNDAFLNLNNSGSSNLLLGGNELQAVAVTSNAYTGEYGRQAGAQVDYTTKSGSNSFHGDAVYDWTGRFLTANDPINKAFGGMRPFANNNQWAASVGGPIVKEKLYFFVNTEGIRYIFGSIHSPTVPTTDFENFVNANVAPMGAATTAFYNNLFNLYNMAPGHANAARNKATATNPVGGCSGYAFNKVTGLIDDPVTGLPLPAALQDGGCTASYTQSVSSGNKEWLLSGRVDYNFDENNKIFGRVKFDRGVQPTYTDSINSAFNDTSTQPQNEGQLNYTHTFSPTVVNNFVGSVLYYSAIFGNLSPGPALNLFPGNLNFVDGSLTALGTGSGNPGGYAQGFLYPQGRNVLQWQLIDDLSIARGNHSFKMGMNFRRDDVNDFTPAEQTLYPAVNTVLPDFAHNEVGAGSVQFNFAPHINFPIAYYSVGFYFQDEYRVNPKLKLTLALRADRNSGGACQKSCASLPLTAFPSLPHGSTIPYNQSFIPGRTTMLPGFEKVVFEPRIGVAWSPFGQNTVIRAGVGVFPDLYPGTILTGFDTNFPNVNQFNVPTGAVAFDLNSPGTTAFPTSGVSLVTQCNTAFLSNFNSGGSLTTGGSSGGGYAGAAAGISGKCLNSSGNLSVPTLNDVNRSLQNPKYVEWNFEIQHSFRAGTLLSFNYVGNHGYSGLIFNDVSNGFGFGSLPAAPADPRVARVNYLYNGGTSNYNGLTVSLQQNLWHGLTGRVNYTYSHSLDDISNGGVLPFSVINSIPSQINPFSINSNYASSDYDARHQISGSYVYQLPFRSENRLMNAAIGGWQLSGTLFYRTGFPFSFVDLSTAGMLAGNNLAGAQILLQPTAAFTRRNFGNVGGCVLTACVTAADFMPSTDFTGGVVGRNAFRGPGFLGGDMSIRKNFTINERMTFQLGLNAYNWFNHANYGGPFPNNNASIFGQVLIPETPPTSPYGAFAAAATDQRIAQITGKLIF
jgi:hypothetical protein